MVNLEKCSKDKLEDCCGFFSVWLVSVEYEECFKGKNPMYHFYYRKIRPPVKL
ncbi:MAG: hypothetical protein P857_875 [Candidatus Xenolissoclinum pacificiensis L6]|uniref:Uncharacterized protein n=1 Tax=Candidatus Xenolissoclinum pacificiensis L6 TaxID=1401685 RepID=W2V2R1_9RICK|nr:MAG: hypothetical protein P857_875 [Candidatus Xenolissoclinum pacificiensis L6]